MDPWELPATELARLLGRREASSVEIVRAHLDRIDRLDGRVHAFTDVFREQALADAAASDAAASTSACSRNTSVNA